MTQANPYQTPQAEEFIVSLDALGLPRSERVTIDADTLVEVHFARYGGASLVIRIVAFVIGSLSLLTFIMNFRLLVTRLTPGLILIFGFIGLSGALLFLWGILGDRINRWLLKSWFAFTRRPEEIEYEFSREGITSHNSKSVIEARWSDIRKWQGTGDVVLAWHSRRKFLILPTHRFSAETRELIGIVRDR